MTRWNALDHVLVSALGPSWPTCLRYAEMGAYDA